MTRQWKRLFAEDNRLSELHSMWQSDRRYDFILQDYFAWTTVPLATLRAWCLLLNIKMPDYTLESGPPNED